MRRELSQVRETHAAKDKEYEKSKSAVCSQLEATLLELEETRKLKKKTEQEKAELLRQIQEAKTSKDETSRAAGEQIAKLEATLADKEAQLSENREKLETLSTQATKAQKAIRLELADVKASLVELQETAQKQKAQLESQLRDVQAELARLQKTNTEALDRSAAEIAALKSQKAALEEQLATASSTAETKFADDIAGLNRQIQEKTERLEKSARIAEADKKRIEELQKDLSSATAQANAMEETLASNQKTIRKLAKISRLYQAKVASKTEENASLKTQVDRLGIDAQKQTEELRRLSDILLEAQLALKAERETSQQLREMVHLKELHRLTTAHEKGNPTDQAKALVSSLKAELGTSSRVELPGESAFVVKASDQKDNQ